MKPCNVCVCVRAKKNDSFVNYDMAPMGGGYGGNSFAQEALAGSHA